MKKKLFTVFDAKVEAYLDPMLARNRGEATRIMVNTLKQAGNVFSQYPEDFTLFEIGEWDDSTGRIVEHEAHIPIKTLIELVEIAKNDKGE